MRFGLTLLLLELNEVAIQCDFSFTLISIKLNLFTLEQSLLGIFFSHWSPSFNTYVSYFKMAYVEMCSRYCVKPLILLLMVCVSCMMKSPIKDS